MVPHLVIRTSAFIIQYFLFVAYSLCKFSFFFLFSFIYCIFFLFPFVLFIMQLSNNFSFSFVFCRKIKLFFCMEQQTACVTHFLAVLWPDKSDKSWYMILTLVGCILHLLSEQLAIRCLSQRYTMKYHNLYVQCKQCVDSVDNLSPF